MQFLKRARENLRSVTSARTSVVCRRVSFSAIFISQAYDANLDSGLHSRRMMWIDNTRDGGLIIKKKRNRMGNGSIAPLFLIPRLRYAAQRATFGQYLRKDKSCSSLHLPKLELSIPAARGILRLSLCDTLLVILAIYYESVGTFIWLSRIRVASEIFYILS